MHDCTVHQKFPVDNFLAITVNSCQQHASGDQGKQFQGQEKRFQCGTNMPKVCQENEYTRSRKESERDTTAYDVSSVSEVMECV